MKKRIILYPVLLIFCTFFTISLFGIIPTWKLGSYDHDAEARRATYASLLDNVDEVYEECYSMIKYNTYENAFREINSKYATSYYRIRLSKDYNTQILSMPGFREDKVEYGLQAYYLPLTNSEGYIIYYPRPDTENSNYECITILISIDWPYATYNSFKEEWCWNFRMIYPPICLVSLIGILVTSLFIVLKSTAEYPVPFVKKFWSTPFMLICIAAYSLLLAIGLLIIHSKFNSDNFNAPVVYVLLTILSLAGGYVLGNLISGIIKKAKRKEFYSQLFAYKIGEKYGVKAQGIYIGTLTLIIMLICGIHTLKCNSPAIFIALVLLFVLWIVFIVYLNKFTDAFIQYANGDWTIKLTKHPLLLTDLYANLHTLGTTMQITVAKSIRDERTKTELITNVSHDIKTPLTSIINYTDLLKQENLTDERRNEYLEVLSRNSARMKKLLEDLIEASKASTGNIELNMTPCNVNTLVSQSVAEHNSNATFKNLKIIYKPQCESAIIKADGAKLFRVFDNLLSNACKYSLSGSRIYVTTNLTPENMIHISFKNTSEQEITISPEELTERFVRGDLSRNSDGSGLGLAIAKSLTELMDGTFTISIDADQFNATLSFSLYE